MKLKIRERQRENTCTEAMIRLLQVAFFAMVFSAASAENNLLTLKDQHDLDALAISLHSQNPYEDIKQEARNQFLSTAQRYGYKVETKYMKHRLESAADELSFSFLQQAINNDPSRPKVYRIITPPRPRDWDGLPVPNGRLSYDNPDCIYRIIPVSDSHSYVIYGARTGVGASDITFSLHTSITASTIAIVAGKDIVMDQDGSFTITVNSSASSSPNHIQSTPAAKVLFIRHNIGDWLVETPDTLQVKRIGGPSTETQTNDTVIAHARESLRRNIFLANFVLGNLTLSRPVNVMVPPSQSMGMGLATQALVLSHYNLKKNDALVVTVEAGPSTYWSLNIYDLFMLTDNPRNRLVSLNHKQAIANRNGSHTFVVSTVDPGVFNWLNTTEQGVGTIVARFQGLPLGGDALSKIQIWTQLVSRDNLHQVLPSDTTYTTPEQRTKQMKIRAQGYDRIHSFFGSYSARSGLQCAPQRFPTGLQVDRMEHGLCCPSV